MTISSEIQKLQTNLTNSYSACEEKGATLPINQNFDNLAETIGTITSGGGSEENFKSVDENGMLTSTKQETVALNGVKSISDYGMYYIYYGGSGMETLNFPDLEDVSARGLGYALQNHTSIKNITFGKPINVGSYSFVYFARNSTLENITFNGVLSIDTYSFQYAFSETNIKELIINPKGCGITSNFQQNYAFAYICNGCPELEKVVICNEGRLSLTHYGIRNGFANCPKLKFVRLGETNLTESNGYGLQVQSYTLTSLFQNDTSLEALYLQGTGGGRNMQYFCDGCSNLVHVLIPHMCPSNINLAGRYMFRNCPKLKVVDFGFGAVSSPTYYGIMKEAFSGTTSGVTIWTKDVTIQNSNTTAANGVFYGCTGLEKVYMPDFIGSSGNGAAYIFNNTGITEFHFSKQNQATIEADPNYSTLWGRGAGNATVYFDLIYDIVANGFEYHPEPSASGPKGQPCVPYSITTNGNTYIRTESDDTDCTFAWKNGNDIVYTCTPTPIEIEAVYNSEYQNVGTVESSVIYYRWRCHTGSRYIYIYILRPRQADVGEDYYEQDSDGNFYVAGQIEEVG